VLIDECHSTGFLGRTGRGTPELFGVQSKVALINSTLGKALGGATGGYTTGTEFECARVGSFVCYFVT
jgi:glycine C-acetyltransferase